VNFFTKLRPVEFVNKLLTNFFPKKVLTNSSSSFIIIIENKRRNKTMRINELSKSEMISYLLKKNYITAKESQKLFLNTPKYEVEKVFIKYLEEK